MAGHFSQDTKEILSRVPLKARTGRLAELHALTAGIGSIDVAQDGNLSLRLQSENLAAVRRGDFLLRVLAGRDPLCSVFRSEKGKMPFYTVTLEMSEALLKLLKELGFLSRNGALRETDIPAASGLIRAEVNGRDFLRGAFLAGGYVSDPESEYHWEVVTRSQARGEELAALLQAWDLPARTTLRKGRSLVYLKSSEAISTTLSLMGAYQSTLQWESARAFRSLQGQVNRQVNCEAANIAKSSHAAADQCKAIEKIREKQGLESLPASLREMALLRLANPEMPLKELGALAHPPVGKSGVNHRLRKIMEIAEGL